MSGFSNVPDAIQRTTTRSPAAKISSILNSRNQGRIELIDELCAEGFVDHDPLLGDSDRDAMKASISGYRAAFPDLASLG